MSPEPAVIEPFDVRAVEAGVRAVEHEGPARLQDPSGLCQHRGEVIDVSRDPDGRHRAERPCREWQYCRVALDDVRGPVPGIAQLIS